MDFRKISPYSDSCNRQEFKNIDQLDEIWRKIFSYLPTNDILGKIARVCKRFYEITKDPTLLKSIKVKNITNYESENIFKVLERSKCLRKLWIIDCDNYKDILSVTLESNSKLKTVILCHEDEMCDDEAVGIIAKNCNNLENLYIQMSISNSALKLIASFNQLKTLHINNENVTIAPDIIDEMANNYSRLEIFHVNFKDFDHIERFVQYIDDDDVPTDFINFKYDKINEMKVAMRSFIQKQKALKKFTFKCDHARYLEFLEEIDLCQELEHIDVRGGYSKNKAEIEALSRLPKLKSLNLVLCSAEYDMPYMDSPPFDPNAAFNSFMANAFFEEMQHLDLSFNEELTTEHLETFSKRTLPNLITLNLNFCSQVNLNDSLLTKLVSNAPKLKLLQVIHHVKIDEVSDELLYKLQMKHILVTMDSEKEKSVEVYVKKNVPIYEYPQMKLFLTSQMKKMGQREDPWFSPRLTYITDFYDDILESYICVHIRV